jgi:hypothetical protein
MVHSGWRIAHGAGAESTLSAPLGRSSVEDAINKVEDREERHHGTYSITAASDMPQANGSSSKHYVKVGIFSA